MMQRFLILFLWIAFPMLNFSQNSFTIKGKIIDNDTRNPLPNVLVKIEGTALEQQTKAAGLFNFADIKGGNYTLHIEIMGYIPINLPITVDNHLDLDSIPLEKDVAQEQKDNIITLTENDLNDDDGGVEVISGLLQASRDVFSSTAAFEFGQTFFSPRGLGAENGTVLLNGVKMNKSYDGRAQWSAWGGLNDAIRHQEFSQYATPSDYNFGGLLATTNISTRASNYSTGFRFSASSSNRNYDGRLMATYNSGLRNNKYAYSISASRRWAEEGFNDGTLYDAYSLFLAFEYQFNPSHSLNFTAIYAPSRRGKSSPNTQEVVALKDSRYNSYWGYQNGEIRNSRIKKMQEPIYMLSHYWEISGKSKLNINIAYQNGKTGNSRLEFGGATALTTSNGNVYYSGGAANPDPAYYQKLPSYFLSNNEEIDYEEVYRSTKEFVDNGQLDWNALYAANQTNAANGRNASYILYEDRNDDTQITATSILNTKLSDHIALNAGVSYQKLTSENFANVLDLLSGTGYLDIDNFSETPAEAPNDLLNPNRVVKEGDRFKYNFNWYANTIDGFAQAKFSFNTMDFYLAGTVGQTSYQREGRYQNGLFPDSSLGKGEKLNFTIYGGKAGLTYKINGRHFIDLNTVYVQHAPTLSNAYSNPRQNHDAVRNSITQQTQSIDASYIIKSPIIKSRLTGYYYTISDASETSVFFADGLNGDTSSLVQEVVTGIEKRNRGIEFGLDAQVTPTLKLKGIAAVGEFIYNTNPNLYLTSDDFEDFSALSSNLKNYKTAGGPQRAFSVGFEYRDPDFWWVGVSTNYFSNAYIAVSPLTRTANFYSDTDGLPFPEYDEHLAKTLLRQEKFDPYYLVNLAGGKSWKIGNYAIGFFASINNALNQNYKTGGFEQARNANYRTLLEDSQNPIPLFGAKYWYGAGANYFVNMYISF